MKKLMVLFLSIAIMGTLTACTVKKDQAEDKTAEIPNPWVKVESVDAAKEKSGENFGTPLYLPKGYGQKEIGIMDDWLIEVLYQKGDSRLTYRACAMAAKKGDISGVYEEYEHTEAALVDDKQVILSGDGHTVALAAWESGEYSYSLYAAPGLVKEEVLKIVESVWSSTEKNV